MGKVMEDYINHKAPSIRTTFQEAPMFNSAGESHALAEYVRSASDRGDCIAEVIIAVKDWHAPRVRLLVKKDFHLLDVTVPFRVETHDLPVSKKELRKEKVKYIITLAAGLLA
jgi:hypothetical protein